MLLKAGRFHIVSFPQTLEKLPSSPFEKLKEGEVGEAEGRFLISCLVPWVMSAVVDPRVSQSLETDQTMPFLNKACQETRDPSSTARFLVHAINVTH